MPILKTVKFHFDWKLTLLVLVLLPLLLWLGFWQLDREAEKLALQTVYEQRQAESPTLLQQLDISPDLQYRQVQAEGEYDNAHIFLLDNKISQGQIGFEVIQAFTTSTGLVVLVNRGWIAQGHDRSELPQTPLVSGKVSLSGSVYMPVGEQLILGDIEPGSQWPKIIQSLNVEQLADLAMLPKQAQLFPYSVRLAASAPGVLTRNWTVISTSPEKHRAYAVQWFAMALALLLLYFYYSSKPLTEKLDKTDSE